mmetsp:Transcript_120429/g.239679  ORF Transcript_120429/g.239679 Transcript_120429/m.239679 type:complete len:219 (+) Transcript_120429:445-1101(+)
MFFKTRQSTWVQTLHRKLEGCGCTRSVASPVARKLSRCRTSSSSSDDDSVSASEVSSSPAGQSDSSSGIASAAATASPPRPVCCDSTCIRISSRTCISAFPRMFVPLQFSGFCASGSLGASPIPKMRSAGEASAICFRPVPSSFTAKALFCWNLALAPCNCVIHLACCVQNLLTILLLRDLPNPFIFRGLLDDKICCNTALSPHARALLAMIHCSTQV